VVSNLRDRNIERAKEWLEWWGYWSPETEDSLVKLLAESANDAAKVCYGVVADVFTNHALKK
jgi:hypothetical protein